MSEQVTAPRFYKSGKLETTGPIPEGSDGLPECLVDKSDSDVDLGTKDLPKKCGQCGLAGYIAGGIFEGSAEGNQGATCLRYRTISGAPVESADAEDAIAPIISDDSLREFSGLTVVNIPRDSIQWPEAA